MMRNVWDLGQARGGGKGGYTFVYENQTEVVSSRVFLVDFAEGWS